MVKVTLKGTVPQVLAHLRRPDRRPARISDLMEGLSRKPHQAISLRADDAWWFEKRNSIEVFFQLPDSKGTVSCRIHIDDLEDWIRRARNMKVRRSRPQSHEG